MLPWFKIVSGAAAALGLAGLVLYDTMTEDQQREADERARELGAALKARRLPAREPDPGPDKILTD